MKLLDIVCLIFMITQAYCIVNKAKTSDNPSRILSNSAKKNEENTSALIKSYPRDIFGGAIMLRNSKKLTNIPINDTSTENVLNTIASQQEANENRRKRNVINLYNMISCTTGCNPLIYKGYGCYCGFLGSGYPVDGIDRCCRSHDWCYSKANCPSYSEYFIPYYWKCYGNAPYCALDQGFFGGFRSCAQRLCECDRLLSNCLKKYPCPSWRAICETSSWRFIQNLLMNY